MQCFFFNLQEYEYLKELHTSSDCKTNAVLVLYVFVLFSDKLKKKNQESSLVSKYLYLYTNYYVYINCISWITMKAECKTVDVPLNWRRLICSKNWKYPKYEKKISFFFIILRVKIVDNLKGWVFTKK